jgi:hypothetical protein
VAAPVVVGQVAAATSLLARGIDVVLVVPPDGDHECLPATGPGRLAVFVGRLEDPAVWEAAEAMAAELFGPRVTGGPA